jgi:hypothetical protein
MKIAFLILAHKQIELVYRQIDALSHSDHYFFIHLDKRYSPDIKNNYIKNPNIYFVNKRKKVNWGGFSIVQATLNLIDEALSTGIDFDYFILMSGQCFPIKPALYIRDFLQDSKGKSFIEIQPLQGSRIEGLGMDKFHCPFFFDYLGFIKKDAISFRNKTYEPKKAAFRLLSFLLKKTGYKRKIPDGLYPCFGSQWWILHKSAIRYVTEYTKSKPKVLDYFKYTWAPDELFFQTILYNSSQIKHIENTSLWYIDWSANGPPRTLTANDTEKIQQSDALFARKFAFVKSYALLNVLEDKL